MDFSICSVLSCLKLEKCLAAWYQHKKMYRKTANKQASNTGRASSFRLTKMGFNYEIYQYINLRHYLPVVTVWPAGQPNLQTLLYDSDKNDFAQFHID